ncbi:hypothetical protein ZIOFF_073680 [Zingiber officinale]|uniref:Uncharacterized protein n=1 Tax=Zingiber officinale TaxID=94328 RepID=A0A8J5C7H6_ZINOF|nr:hypothetical protein ZIOFF_073680 [Zingiber officinale]
MRRASGVGRGCIASGNHRASRMARRAPAALLSPFARGAKRWKGIAFPLGDDTNSLHARRYVSSSLFPLKLIRSFTASATFFHSFSSARGPFPHTLKFRAGCLQDLFLSIRFCGFTSNGGIFRAKQHIAGNSKNVRKCKECPQSVRDELLNYMNEKKKQTLRACGGMKQDFCFLYVDEDEEDAQAVQPSSKESKKRSLTSTEEIGSEIALVGFIYNHESVLHMMRKCTENKELARHGVTRFATIFLILQSLHKRQKALKRMFLSTQWIESKWAKDAKGKRANDTVFMPSFWNNVTYTLKVMCPLVMVLRIADNETRPAMGYIYEAIDRAKETILKSFDNNREKCKNVLDIIDSRWDRQLHHPLHAAGYYLNPYFYYHNPKVETDTEVTNGLFACIQRLIPSPELRDKIIMEELPVYKNSESLFGNEFAIRARNNKDQPMTPCVQALGTDLSPWPRLAL